MSAYTSPRRAIVTGASTGIGEETVRELRRRGWHVVATARRHDRLAALAAETGCEPFTADLTSDDDVAALAQFATSRPDGIPVSALINNAGGARGVDRVEDADIERWCWMFEVSVIGTLRLTRAVLPHLRAAGGGDLLFVTSTAAHDTYPGGAGYVAAKHAERMIPLTLRQELVGEPIRVIEIAPGLVHTPEFSLNRLGSAEKAAAVYAGVAEPLTGADVAHVIAFALDAPPHVNLDRVIVRPVAQATNTLIARD